MSLQASVFRVGGRDSKNPF